MCLIQSCRYTALSAFGVQSLYSILRVSANQDCLDTLSFRSATALSEERLAGVDLRVRHPLAWGTPNLPLSAKSLSAVSNVGTTGKVVVPKAMLNSCNWKEHTGVENDPTVVGKRWCGSVSTFPFFTLKSSNCLILNARSVLTVATAPSSQSCPSVLAALQSQASPHWLSLSIWQILDFSQILSRRRGKSCSAWPTPDQL